MGQESADRRRLQRIEELRRDLSHKNPARVIYARQTLLTMLWLEEERVRRQVISALCRYLPEETQPQAEFAIRLSQHLAAHSIDPAVQPADVPAIHAALDNAAFVIMKVALQRLKLVVGEAGSSDDESRYRETDVCRDALVIAHCFQLTATVEPTVQTLRLFPPDLARGVGPLARQTGPLRDAAAHLLGSLSPDALYAFWYALGSPDRTARRDLLPVLDYLNDARATPYLVRLFERRGQWSDGEMVGWFAVRAFKRIRDRRALPALRRVVSAANSGILTGPAAHASPDLIREVQRAIEAIEYGRTGGAREELLRPSQPPSDQLLHASQLPTDDLLRPSQQTDHDLIRPADPQAHELLRASRSPAGDLLRAANTQVHGQSDRDELMRANVEPENPFESFDPAASF